VIGFLRRINKTMKIKNMFRAEHLKHVFFSDYRFGVPPLWQVPPIFFPQLNPAGFL
jgi:hypothetical protein